MRSVLGFITMAALIAAVPTRGDEPSKARPTIATNVAKDHIDEMVTVSMTVNHAKDGTHRKTYYLDSEADYKGPNNLALVISYKDAESFKKAGIADIVKHFEGKVIEVTGTVIHDDNQTCIRVTAPDQIKIVGPKAP